MTHPKVYIIFTFYKNSINKLPNIKKNVFFSYYGGGGGGRPLFLD